MQAIGCATVYIAPGGGARRPPRASGSSRAYSSSGSWGAPRPFSSLRVEDETASPATSSGRAQRKRSGSLGHRRPQRARVALERDPPERDGVARAHGEGSGHDAQAVALLELAGEVGPAARLERRLRHLPHAVEQAALGAAHEQDPPVPLDERGGHGHVHRRPARPALGQLVDEPERAGPAALRAAGRRRSRGCAAADGGPSSISAWFQSPGRSRSSSSSARL